MTRVASGAVLLLVAIAIVWFAPPALFLLAAEALVVLACIEFAAIARASGVSVPVVLSSAAAVVTAAAFARLVSGALAAAPVDVVLMSALIAIGAAASPHGGVARMRCRRSPRRCCRRCIWGCRSGR